MWSYYKMNEAANFGVGNVRKVQELTVRVNNHTALNLGSPHNARKQKPRGAQGGGGGGGLTEHAPTPPA
jgi:hypothetical protein